MALNFKLACSDRSTTGSGSWTGTALFRTQPALQATLHELRTLGHIELETKLEVCKSVHQSTIQINHQPDATILQFILLTFIYSSTCFGHSPAHHHELNDWSSSLPFYLRIVVIAVLCSWSGRPAGWLARPRTQHAYHHKTRGCYGSHWAPDNGRENVRNMLSCK